MGQSSDGILVYGWDLGGCEGETPGWAEEFLESLQGAYTYEDFLAQRLDPSLVDPSDEIRNLPESWFYAGGNVGYRNPESAEYLAWKESSREPKKAYEAAKKELEKEAKIQLHCAYEYAMYVLTIPEAVMKAPRGYPEVIDFEELAVRIPEWDERLTLLAHRLGLEPDEGPKLILTSLFG